MRKTLTLVASLTLLLVTGTGMALAQDTTVPPATTTTAASSAQTIDAGTIAPGTTKTVSACGYAAGSTVNVTANGAPWGSTPADSAGCVSVTIAVGTGTGLGTHRIAAAGLELAAARSFTVTIGGVSKTFGGNAQNNTVVLSGAGSNGATRTVTFVFDINSASGGSALARTGGMILRWSLAAVALMAVGTLLVLADRRRKVVPVKDEWSTKR
jgi:hypothetical protein